MLLVRDMLDSVVSNDPMFWRRRPENPDSKLSASSSIRAGCEYGHIAKSKHDFSGCSKVPDLVAISSHVPFDPNACSISSRKLSAMSSSKISSSSSDVVLSFCSEFREAAPLMVEKVL